MDKIKFRVGDVITKDSKRIFKVIAINSMYHYYDVKMINMLEINTSGALTFNNAIDYYQYIFNYNKLWSKLNECSI